MGGHQDAPGLVDDGTGVQGLAELRGQGAGLRVPLAVGDGGGRRRGVEPQQRLVEVAEAVRLLAVQVQRSGELLIDVQRRRQVAGDPGRPGAAGELRPAFRGLLHADPDDLAGARRFQAGAVARRVLVVVDGPYPLAAARYGFRRREVAAQDAHARHVRARDRPRYLLDAVLEDPAEIFGPGQHVGQIGQGADDIVQALEEVLVVLAPYLRLHARRTSTRRPS